MKPSAYYRQVAGAISMAIELTGCYEPSHRDSVMAELKALRRDTYKRLKRSRRVRR